MSTLTEALARPSGVAGLRYDARINHACPFCGAEPRAYCRGESDWSVVPHDARIDLALSAKNNDNIRWGFRMGRDHLAGKIAETVAAVKEGK